MDEADLDGTDIGSDSEATPEVPKPKAKKPKKAKKEKKRKIPKPSQAMREVRADQLMSLHNVYSLCTLLSHLEFCNIYCIHSRVNTCTGVPTSERLLYQFVRCIKLTLFSHNAKHLSLLQEFVEAIEGAPPEAVAEPARKKQRKDPVPTGRSTRANCKVTPGPHMYSCCGLFMAYW